MDVIELRELLDTAITDGKGGYTVMYFEDARGYEVLEIEDGRLLIDFNDDKRTMSIG